jgi:hypothetical protein
MYTRTQVKCVLCNKRKTEARPKQDLYVPFTFEDDMLRALLPVFKILLSDLCNKCVMSLSVTEDETCFVLEKDAKVAAKTRRRMVKILSKRIKRIYYLASFF